MTTAWTCPFCPLACDGLQADLSIDGSEPCARAAEMLALHAPGAGATALRDGQPCEVTSAIGAAAAVLARSRQPLFAGLGADVAAARALYPLACATGAVVDSAGSDDLMHGLRALQDRGQFTTTLAEVRTRADLIVFIGGLPLDAAPLLRQRLGVGDPQVPARHVVVLGASPAEQAALAGWAGAGVSVEALPLAPDLHGTLALLAAHLAGRTAVALPASLLALAERLRQARYAVLVGTPARLPAHGALVVEAVHRVVGHLNTKTRAAALWLGGGNGVATANQVHTWLSGVPLRSRAGPRGLEHEPWLFGTSRLLADAAVDAVLWLSLFNPQAHPPAHPMIDSLPLVVLGPPALAVNCQRPGSVFIPVATPGVDAAGHVFRTDGTVLMPLQPWRPRSAQPLPDAADVLHAITQALTLRQAA